MSDRDAIVFSPNYTQWPFNTFPQGERDILSVRLSQSLVHDLVQFAVNFQGRYDEMSGKFAGGEEEKIEFRNRYRELTTRLIGEGVRVQTDYWWDPDALEEIDK